jgi:hypothetical protein
MKLDFEDCCQIPSSDVVHLSDHLIRFRFQRPRDLSQNLRFLVEGEGSIEKLFPDAANRAAVEHNVRAFQKALDASFERERANLRSLQVLSARDYAEFNVQHHCRPSLIYTNGQAAATVVERPASGFEVALHAVLRKFLAFCNEYEFPDFIRGNQVRRFGTLVEVELWVREFLSNIEVSMVPMFKGDSSASLVLRRVGERRGEHGYPETIYSVIFSGERSTVRVGGAHEAYRVLNEIELDGFRVKACATCRNFRFSGMSRDMSRGSAGYCTFHTGIDPRTNFKDLPVSVYSLCSNHDFVNDVDRDRPYLRS